MPRDSSSPRSTLSPRLPILLAGVVLGPLAAAAALAASSPSPRESLPPESLAVEEDGESEGDGEIGTAGDPDGSVQEGSKNNKKDRSAALEALRRQNEQLAARVAALENAREEDGDDDLREDALVDRWLQQGLVTGYQDVRLTVQVFGDTTFRHDNPEPPGRSNSSFALGAMDLFATAQMGDHFQVLSETVFSVNNESASASQERLWGQWTFNDALYAKLGLEHGLVSRWNRIFHHGPWLEPTIDRPLLARFEGDAQGILPLHNAGLEVGGHAELAAGRLEYAGIVSNGRGENPRDKQRVSDSNRAKGYELATAFVPACLEGLRFGGTFRYDQIPVDPTSPNPVRMRGIDEVIGSGFVELRHGHLEARGEFAHVANRLDAGGANFDHQAGFAQVAWRQGMWLPYARFDVRRMERGDPFFAPLDRDLDRWQQTLGVRIDIHSHAAVKVEFGFGVAQKRAAAGNVDEGHFVSTAVQLSWAI